MCLAVFGPTRMTNSLKMYVLKEEDGEPCGENLIVIKLKVCFIK